MTLSHAVHREQAIDITAYRTAREALTEHFKLDEDWLQMALEQFDKINTFKTIPRPFFALWVPRNVAHLEVHFTIVLRGGDRRRPPGFVFSHLPTYDLNFLLTIPSVFKRLETLTVVVHSTGAMTPGAVYYDAAGTLAPVHSPYALPARNCERSVMFTHWLNEVDALILPQWRNGGCPKKRMLLRQCDSGVSGVMLRLPAPARWEDAIQVVDALAGRMYFGDDAFW